MTQTPDLPPKSYVVTAKPDLADMHFVHHTGCPVLPDTTLVPLGAFCGSVPAVEVAHRRFEAVQACALCCPDGREIADEAA
ncbi:MAG: hypothetical protein CML68_11735 [Rhodobacteraceae bacterium]|nr:hypothetical protein [Paracoccaceae bacterium]